MTASSSGGGGGKNFKVVLLGEGCVGKTSLVLRYVENKFNEKHLTTLQVRLTEWSIQETNSWYLKVLFVTMLE